MVQAVLLTDDQSIDIVAKYSKFYCQIIKHNKNIQLKQEVIQVQHLRGVSPQVAKKLIQKPTISKY